MDEIKANKIYDILVNIGGAPEKFRDDFVYIHCFDQYGCEEYRFQGKFGFGGKYWSETNSVNCYGEDLTPERELIIKQLNEELAKL